MLARAALRLRTRALPLQRALCAPAEAGAGPGQRALPPFAPGLLDILVCPLSKRPLRYEESTNELINEELGIAYPIVDGIPNMIPQAARMMGKEKQEPDSEQTKVNGQE